MISLLLLVFLLQLTIHLVNTVGASTVNDLLWQVYSKVQLSASKGSQDQIKLQKEILRLKKELAGVSAQDNFSKWAKLRRQHDKLVAEYEKTSSSTQANRAYFDQILNTLRWIGLTGFRMVIQFWFAKRPLYWIPQGWLPYYAEWILSFPKAPLGSISVNVWSIACASVISMISEAVIASMVLVMRQPKAKEVQAMKAGGAETGSSQTASKKEL